jgi:hypothetical protein
MRSHCPAAQCDSCCAAAAQIGAKADSEWACNTSEHAPVCTTASASATLEKRERKGMYRRRRFQDPPG